MPENWSDGDSYEMYVGRWSRQVAAQFLAWLAVPAGARWLDLGCGTGALTGCVLRDCAPASVIGVEPSDAFLSVARQHVTDVRAVFRQGAADRIPLGDGEVDAVRRFWDAAVALDPGARERDEGVRFPICRPGPLRELFEGAGLRDVGVEAVDIVTPYRDFDDYWTPFLGGVGPAPGYCVALAEEARDALRERLRQTLPTDADGRILLAARAWAVRGTR
jgi:SAM-dependent methyltransferase